MATFGGHVEARFAAVEQHGMAAETSTANETACMSALGLHSGANVSELEKSYGLTALHHAAAEGNVEVAKQMLENVGMTALHWAGDGGHDETAKQIFENVGNANVDEILVLVRDSKGQQAIWGLTQKPTSGRYGLRF